MAADKQELTEKLVPYVEGVLGEPDLSEVRRLLESDPQVAAEAKRLEASVTNLRQAFWAGARPASAGEPEVDHVIKMAAGELTERRDLRIQVAESDQAQAELALLRQLDQDLQDEPTEEGEIPPMSDRVQAAFRELCRGEQELKPAKGWFQGLLSSLWLKPAAAFATCVAVLCLGVVWSSNQSGREGSTVAVEQPPVAIERSVEATPLASPPTFGVKVAEGQNRDQLQEQAQMLLDNKVQYSVKEEGLFVTKEEADKARSVLAKNEAVEKKGAKKELNVVVPERYSQASSRYRRPEPEEEKSQPSSSKVAQAAPLGPPPEKQPFVDEEPELEQVETIESASPVLDGASIEPEQASEERIDSAGAIPPTEGDFEPADDQPQEEMAPGGRYQTRSALKPKGTANEKDEGAGEAKAEKRATLRNANAPRSVSVARAPAPVVSNIGVEDRVGWAESSRAGEAEPEAGGKGANSGVLKQQLDESEEIALRQQALRLEEELGVRLAIVSREDGSYLVTALAENELSQEEVATLQARIVAALGLDDRDKVVVHQP